MATEGRGQMVSTPVPNLEVLAYNLGSETEYVGYSSKIQWLYHKIGHDLLLST